MSADAGADGRAMAALQAKVSDLGARLVQLEAKVDALENPESPVDRNARSLAEMSDKIDGENPERVPGNSVAELEARKRLTAVE